MMEAVNPGFAIVLGLLVVAILVWIYWPNKGLMAIIKKGRLNKQRVWMEDALKFLFDCEYKKISCRLNSIAGNLNISADKATRIMDRLRSMELVQSDGNLFTLTDTGRYYALRIIRVHRIWERYLADETTVNQMDWHGSADRKEHELSVEAADALAAQMGNPVFDPHGDPIPTSEGVMPKLKGQPLSALKKGDLARIVHIEDEPKAIYAQLVALELYPGMEIYVLDASEGKIEFTANGDECVLASMFAANVTVEVMETQDQPEQEKYELLTSLEIGESAFVQGISPVLRGQQRRRLMDLGIVPGTKIMAELRGTTGDPTAYKILETTIAIRKDQAKHIFIKKINEKKYESTA